MKRVLFGFPTVLCLMLGTQVRAEDPVRINPTDPQPTCTMCPGTYIPAAELESYTRKAIAEKMIDQQSMESDQEKRKRLVWEIDSKLQQAVARPIEFYLRKATCWRPEVKGLNVMVNSSYNGWRFEDVWLDK